MSTFLLTSGTKGVYNAKRVEVQNMVGPDRVLVIDESSEPYLIAIDEFRPIEKMRARQPALHESSWEWDEADRRYEIIEPLVQDASARATLEEVKARAAVAGVHFTTVYRWIRAYAAAGNRPSGLKPRTHDRGPRKKRLDAVSESIVSRAIQDFYLSDQQLSIKSTHSRLHELCTAANIPTPHYNTLRKRIASISHRERMSRRARRKAASDMYDPRPGKLEVCRPWEVVEVDHTQADVLLVDRTHGRPIGRPNITVALDLYSRCVVGFYVSLEPVSANTAGLCLVNAMLPKPEWLTSIDAKVDWPCYGRPATIHVDNAMEFHGKMLHRACLEYTIALQFRKLRIPESNGHIEALMKTLSLKIHELEGTTFFDVAHRGEYKSEKKACLTLQQFERWLALAIAEYHESFHSEIKDSPKHRYRAAFQQGPNRLPLATPELFDDATRLRIDFMPYEERTVQQYGVQLFRIRYFHHVLRRFVNAKGEVKKRKFRFHYDPRDISRIYFYDPELEQYFPIPYADGTNPSISKWESIEAERHLVKAGRANIDEAAIMEIVKQRRAIEQEAASKTKAARRNSERVSSAAAIPKLSVVNGDIAKHIVEQAGPRVKRPFLVEDA